MGIPDIMRAKVSSKGWVVIPAVLRRRYGLMPGTMVEFTETDNKIVIIPGSRDPVEEFYGKFAGDRSLTKELRKERTEELKREETRLCIR